MFNMFRNKVSKPSSWEEEYNKNKALHKGMIERDLFEGWENIKVPFNIGDSVFYSIKILFARGDKSTALEFARRSSEQVQRALSEGLIESCARFNSDVNVNLCKSIAKKNLAYARIIIEGKVDIPLLKESIDDLLEGISDEYSRTYYDQVEYDLLTAVLLLLICGDSDKANNIYKMVRKKHKIYNECFNESVLNILDSRSGDFDISALRKYIDLSSYPVFPNFHHDRLYIMAVIHQFELGLLYCFLAGKVNADFCNVGEIVEVVNPRV